MNCLVVGSELPGIVLRFGGLVPHPILGAVRGWQRSYCYAAPI